MRLISHSSVDARIVLHAAAHFLAEALDVGSAGVAAIDQEVAVQLGDLRVADHEAAAAGGIDQLPGLVPRRVLEGRAAGAALHRLRGLALAGDLVHLGGDRRGVAGRALKQRRGEDHVLGHAAMPIGEMHVGVRIDADVAGAIDAARFDQNVLGLTPIGAAVHAQRAADRARNAAQEREPGDAGLLRGLGDAQIRHRGSGAHAMVRFDPCFVEAAPEPDHDTCNAAVAHDQVRAEADDRDGNLARQVRQRIGEIALVFRHEQRLRRPADAKPGQRRERLVARAAGRAVAESLDFSDGTMSSITS